MTSEDSPASDFTRLVQHVALNESGWWEHAVERLVLACAYTLGPSSHDDVVNGVVESCGVQANSERVNSTIRNLVESGELIEQGGSLRVSEAAHEALHQQQTATLDSEKNVRVRFGNMARERGLEDQEDELWRILETEVVLPVVRHMGARMYGLLTADLSDGNSDLESHLREFLSRHSDQIRTFLVDFIEPRDDDVRRFVLRRLNAQYALDAAALPDDALERLSLLDHKAGRVDVFLDTNFLFSVLGLHENPGDDVANELLQLVQELQGRVDLRLYVIPETVNETRRVLQDVIFRLKGFRGQPNLAEAAKRTTSLGLTSRYLEAASNAGRTLTAEDFFGPYESDLLTVLRSKGVELYNADLSYLHVDQNVIDDLHDQSEAQEKFRSRGQKSYEANLHDMVLLHFTRSRRSPAVESPLETNAWVATLDYGLISFDRKQRVNGAGPPVCLEPSSLIQLFQFWIPSSINLDEALVGSVRQPLLFLTFDKQSEQVTLRILSEISRFEGIGDLDVDTVSAILTSTALRNRLEATENDLSNDQELVREAMVNVVRELGDEMTDLRSEQDEALRVNAELKKQVAATKKTAESHEAARLDAEQALATEVANRRRVEREHLQVTEAAAQLESRLTDLEARNKTLETHLEGQDQKNKKRRENRRFGSFAFATTILSATALVAGATLLDRWTKPASAWFIASTFSVLLMFVGLEFSARGTRHEESIPLQQVQKLRRSSWTFVLAVVASIIAGILL